MILNYVIFNGALLPIDQANISIFNQALFSSFGVYETVKVDRGHPFYLEDHLRRLLQSARMIDLDLGVDTATLAGWFNLLLQIDPRATWSLRLIALGALEAGAAPVIAMQPTPLPVYPAQLYQTGAAAILYEGQRFMPQCKSLNTLVSFLARREANRNGAVEGLLHHAGYLTEGSRSNLFAVRQGELLTPPTPTVLSGITREVILQVVQAAGQPVVEMMLPVDLSLYDEFFISSTSMHVLPVTRINGRPIGNGQVGPVTKLAMAQFEAHYRQVMGDHNE
jgi:branched-subunit amino acid aminotransferase/4-amino-4-deoxychorismate lyase